MDWVVRMVSQIRAVRSEMNVSPGAKIPMLLKGASDVNKARLDTHRNILSSLARLSSLDMLEGDAPKGSVQDVIDEAIIVLPLADVIDVASEAARLEKEIAKLETEIAKHDKKLANKGFTDKAPAEVVETERQRRDEESATLEKVVEALERLKAL
jgi:valyl-tRNA synthetase